MTEHTHAAWLAAPSGAYGVMADYEIGEDGIMRFPAGTWVDQASQLVWGEVNQLDPGSGKMIRAEFNGTPMDGYPNDHCPQAIYLRWHYERELIQAGRA